MLTLISRTMPTTTPLPPEYALRAVTADDIPALARLYFVAYDAGEAAASIDEARDDIEASFAGDYGPLWAAASPVILTGSRVVAAALVVHRAPWPDTPPGPFLIEVFTDRTHRRRGLATALIAHATATVLAAGQTSIGLRVGKDNTRARRLYAALGFHAPGAETAGPTTTPTGSTDQ